MLKDTRTTMFFREIMQIGSILINFLIKIGMQLTKDVPILDYLARLKKIGENPEDYASIWFYF